MNVNPSANLSTGLQSLLSTQCGQQALLALSNGSQDSKIFNAYPFSNPFSFVSSALNNNNTNNAPKIGAFSLRVSSPTQKADTKWTLGTSNSAFKPCVLVKPGQNDASTVQSSRSESSTSETQYQAMKSNLNQNQAREDRIEDEKDDEGSYGSDSEEEDTNSADFVGQTKKSICKQSKCGSGNVGNGYKSKKYDKVEWDNSFNNVLREAAKFYKHDWKKISRRIFRETDMKFRPSVLSKIFRDIKQEDPELKEKVKFSAAEDLALIESVTKHGLKWSQIKEELGGRSEMMVKNRYYYLKKSGKMDQLLRGTA